MSRKKAIIILSSFFIFLLLLLVVFSLMPKKRDLEVVIKNGEFATSTLQNLSLVKVVRVVDGDTIVVEGGEYVRYIGIDTPETVDERKPVQCFGIEASNKNRELVEGKMVRLEKDISDRDKYNRLLRYVWVDGVLINKILVEEGFARASSYPPDLKYENEFVDAEKKARESVSGLWNCK